MNIAEPTILSSMFEPSTQPETLPIADQIEHDLNTTIESGIKQFRQKKENPKLARTQASESTQLANSHKLDTSKILERYRKVRQQIAPSSLPKNFSIQNQIKEQIKHIKEKFFSKLFKIIPPSIMVFLNYFLHIKNKPPQQSEKTDSLASMNISLPIIGSVNIGKFIKENFKKAIPENKTNSLPEVIKGNKLTDNPQFLAKVDQIVSKIGCSRAALLKIMQKESGINPQNKNPITKATGLIQFMPKTARGLGTTVQALSRMSGIQQLDYVEKFYKPYFGKIHSYSDLYLATFYPFALGKPANFILGSEKNNSYAHKVAKQNKSISHGKFYITVADFRHYAGAEPRAIS